MFERFNARARQLVVDAQHEARALKHNYIGTEHILLGLLKEEAGIAARVLDALDVTAEEVRGQVARIVGQGDVVTTGQIPFTPRAKRILELALQESLMLGHRHIGAEHILLGLARENGGVASRILLDQGVDAERIRSEVFRTIGTVPRPDYEERMEARRWALEQADRSLRLIPGDRHVPVILAPLLFVAIGIGILIGWLIWG